MSLRNAVLAEAARAPGRSHEIFRRLKNGLGEFWPVNDGNVYQMLTSSVDKGWLDSSGDADGRAVYTITDAGRAEIDAWLHEDGADPAPARNELYLKLEYCEDAPPPELVHAVEDQLHKSLRASRRIRQLISEAEGRGRKIMLEGVLAHAEADIAWLEDAKGSIARLANAANAGKGSKAGKGRSKKD